MASSQLSKPRAAGLKGLLATPGRLAAAGLALVPVLFLSVAVLGDAALRGLRADLTEDRLYTVSEASGRVLADLPETVVLRFYVSRNLTEAYPAFAAYARRIEDLLQVYRTAADGRLQVEKIEPEAFSEEEDRAVAAGLQAQQLDSSGAVGFFGIVGSNLTDDSRNLPFLSPARERFLEQDLTRLIYDLAHPDKPKLGVIDGIGLMGDAAGGGQGQVAFSQLAEIFRPTTVDPADRAALEASDVLLVVQPAELSEDARYNLDQVILAGKPALLVLDPARDATTSGREAAQQSGPPALAPLLAGWGIDFTANSAVVDWEAGEEVQAQIDGRPVSLRYPLWFGATGSALNRDDAVTAELERVNLRAAGAFTRAEGEREPKEATLTGLVTTTLQSAEIPTMALQMLRDPRQLEANHKPDEKIRSVVARLSGTVRSGFETGRSAPPPVEGQPAPPEPPAFRPEGSVNVVLLGDADMLMDRAWLQVADFMGQRLVQPTANNGDLLGNALQSLAGVPGLHGLRGRGLADRPFTRLVALQQEARAQYQSREQELQQDLQQTQERLNNLSGAQVDEQGNVLLTAEQQQEVQSFRERQLEIRRELRSVQGELRRDVERVEVWLKLLTVVFVPLAVAAASVGIAVLQRRRRRARARALVAAMPA